MKHKMDYFFFISERGERSYFMSQYVYVRYFKANENKIILKTLCACHQKYTWKFFLQLFRNFLCSKDQTGKRERGERGKRVKRVGRDRKGGGRKSVLKGEEERVRVKRKGRERKKRFIGFHWHADLSKKIDKKGNLTNCRHTHKLPSFLFLSKRL